MNEIAERRRRPSFAVLLIALANVFALDAQCPRALAQVAAGAGDAQIQGPDLSVVILRSGDDPRPLLAPGQTFTLSIGVDNLKGQSVSHSSVLTVKLPSGLTLNHSSTPPDRADQGGDGTTLVWNLGTIEARAFPRLFALSLTVAGTIAVPAKVAVSAQVVTSDRDVNPTHESTTMTLYIRPPAADLLMGSDLEAVALTIGEPVEFNAEISNEGNVIASAAALTVTLPSGIAFKSGEPLPNTINGKTLIWQLGDLAPAVTSVVNITIALDTSLTPAESDATPSPESVLTFRFDVSTTAVQAEPKHNHREVDKHVERAGSNLKAWLNVEGADNPGELPVGKDVTYAITYGNFGNAPAQHALLSLSLWEGLNFVHAEPPAARSAKSERFAGGVQSWDVGDLEVGQSNIIKVQLHVTSVPEDGSLVMATIVAPGPSANSGENVAYSWQHAPRAAGHHGPIAQSGHLLRWVAAMLILLAVLWAGFRARRRPAQ